MINIKNLIKSAFIYIGLEPPRKLPKQNNIKQWLKQPAIDFKRTGLEALVTKIRRNNDHDFYDLILNESIKDISLDFIEREFIGYGVGKENLNCYRKITLKNSEELFEKTYYSDNNKLDNLKWFHDNLATELKKKINVPDIKFYFPGEFLTVVYFEFSELNSLAHKAFEPYLVEASLALYKFSSLQLTKGKETTPDFFQDFKKHNYYADNIQYALEKTSGSLNLSDLKKHALNGPYVLSHGDLSETNVCEDNTIIDWDSCGYFPLGLDIAKIYFRLIVNNIADSNLTLWLERNYKHSISEKHWNDLTRNFLFFLFVFVQSLKADEKINIKEIENSIISELKGMATK